MTDHIRWASEPEITSAAYSGYAGTFDVNLFRIYAPDESDDRWILASLLPGSEHRSGYGLSAEELYPVAERLLSEFVSSLGASFAEPPSDAIVRWQDVRTGDLVLLDDCLITAERVEVYQSPWGDGTTFPAAHIGHRLDNGVLVDSERHGDRFTAVRRPATAGPAGED